MSHPSCYFIMTELEIVNFSLMTLGEPTVTAAEYATGTKFKSLELIKAQLPNHKRYLLRLFPWNCAVRRSLYIPLYRTLTISVLDYDANTTASDTLTYQNSENLYENVQRVWNGSTYRITRETDGDWRFQNLSGTNTYNENERHRSHSIQSPILFDAASWNLVWEQAGNHILKSIAYSSMDVDNDPKSDFTYRVLSPCDFAKSNPVRIIDSSSHRDRDFRVEGNYLYTNEQQGSITYTEDIDYTDLDDMLAEVLALRAAKAVAWAVVQSDTRTREITGEYERCLRKARSVDSAEDGRYTLESNIFTDARNQ